MIKIFHSKSFSINLVEKGVYYTVMNDNEKISRDQIVQFVDSMDAVIQREHHVSIFDITDAIKFMTKGRDYLVETEREHNRNIVAVGIVAKTSVARAIGNFFVQVRPPKFPIKLFKDLGSAEAWAKLVMKDFRDSQSE